MDDLERLGTGRWRDGHGHGTKTLTPLYQFYFLSGSQIKCTQIYLWEKFLFIFEILLCITWPFFSIPNILDDLFKTFGTFLEWSWEPQRQNLKRWIVTEQKLTSFLLISFLFFTKNKKKIFSTKLNFILFLMLKMKFVLRVSSP